MAAPSGVRSGGSLSSMRCAACTRRSRVASATVGSSIQACRALTVSRRVISVASTPTLAGQRDERRRACLYNDSNTDIINCMNGGAPSDPSYPLADLCVLADLPARTVRYYIQIGLVDRPEGETRAARYGARHLEQLLLIRKWTTAGVSLERIRELLQGDAAPVPPRPRAPGSLEVCSHLTVADGVELVIEPGRAGLSPEQVRALVRGIMRVFGEVIAEGAGARSISKEKEQ
jgi:DNA-binding transcriptional MerR regulator